MPVEPKRGLLPCQLFLHCGGIFPIWVDLEIFFIGVLGTLLVFQLLPRLAEAKHGIREVGIPFECFFKPVRRSLKGALFEVVIPNPDFLGSLQRIESVVFGRGAAVFFRRFLILGIRLFPFFFILREDCCVRGQNYHADPKPCHT